MYFLLPLGRMVKPGVLAPKIRARAPEQGSDASVRRKYIMSSAFHSPCSIPALSSTKLFERFDMTASDILEPAVTSSPEPVASHNPPNAFDWQAQRDRISSLYEHHTIPQVQRIMMREQNFHAT
jgi:Clr5 domain